MEATSANQATVSRHLSRLIANGIVAKQGTTRGARFDLIHAVKYWQTPASMRPAVPFTASRFDDYEPNCTAWLTPVAKSVFDAEPCQKLNMHATWRRRILERFLIDLAWASSAFEGNTYSALDTEVLVRYGQEADGKTPYEATMILNHKRAIRALIEMSDCAELTEEMINTLHRELMHGLTDPTRCGQVRAGDIAISSSAYRPCRDPVLLRQQLGSLAWKASHIQHPGEAAFFLLAGTACLQAFEDGNKRLDGYWPAGLCCVLVCLLSLLWG